MRYFNSGNLSLSKWCVSVDLDDCTSEDCLLWLNSPKAYSPRDNVYELASVQDIIRHEVTEEEIQSLKNEIESKWVEAVATMKKSAE